MTLKDRLHPSRFIGMSGKMAAFVAYLLGEVWTDPQIADMAITSDGFVSIPDDVCFATASDLERNLANLADAAELTPEERRALACCYARKVTDWRSTAQYRQPSVAFLLGEELNGPRSQ